MVAVTVSLVFPYIREYCSAYLFVHITIASIGLIWLCRDLITFTESVIRSGLNFVLDKIVLDDLLRAIYDPTDGLCACVAGTFMGASSMYGLRMSEDQRTELIQSSLFLKDETQAHSVLLEPGGFKALLPDEVQNWLQASQEDEDEFNSAQLSVDPSTIIVSSSSSSLDRVTDGIGLESDKSTSDCDIAEIDEQERDFHYSHIVEESLHNTRGPNYSYHRNKFNSFEDEIIPGSSEPKAQERQGNTEGSNQTDPLTVFFRILQKLALKKIRPYAEALPRSKIENLGITAAVALGIQLALRRSSKKSPLVGSFCVGIATLSFGTILSREAILGNVHNKETMQLACKGIASRILNRLKGKSLSNKAFFAMLSLVIFCRGKQATRGIPANSK